MHIHLAEEGRVHGEAVAFVGQDGHVALQAVGLEDGFRDAEGQAVEGTDGEDAVVAFLLGEDAFADGGEWPRRR